jgi:hypothetical protein
MEAFTAVLPRFGDGSGDAGGLADANEKPLGLKLEQQAIPTETIAVERG